MRPALPHLAALALAALAVSCGGESAPPPPPLTWTWVPIAGSVCNDGSPTGIGIEPSAKPDADVLVFLDGGGACWDYTTCWYAHTATTGPFGETQLQQRLQAGVAGTIFDRTAPGNPYKDFTFVFVPYCTGDVHSGDTVRTYAPASPWHFNGRVNVANAFQYLAAGLPAPAKVVVSGSSAGGFGSLLAFTRAKAAWPAAEAYLVDDSGPPLANIPTATVSAWVAEWDLGTAIDEVCGAPCAGTPPTLAPVLRALAEANPGDRFALLSSTQDLTIRSFFFNPSTYQPMSGADFQAALASLVADLEAASTGNAHAFVVTGTSHTMLGSPAAFTSQGTALFDWLSRQVNDEPSWSAATPF